MKRTWIKLHLQGALRGSIRFQLTPAERSVWYDLLMLAGESRKPGTIQASNEMAYPDNYLYSQLRVPRKLWESTIEKCIAAGRLTQNTNGLHITNWAKYQSEPSSKRLQPSDNPPLPPAPPVQPAIPGRTAPPQPQSPTPAPVPKRRSAPAQPRS